jgi:hypothetical protein
VLISVFFTVVFISASNYRTHTRTQQPPCKQKKLLQFKVWSFVTLFQPFGYRRDIFFHFIHIFAVKPEVTVFEPKLWRRRGDDVTLECETVAQPIDECYWERNSYRLRPTAGKYDLEVSAKRLLKKFPLNFMIF